MRPGMGLDAIYLVARIESYQAYRGVSDWQVEQNHRTTRVAVTEWLRVGTTVSVVIPVIVMVNVPAWVPEVP